MTFMRGRFLTPGTTAFLLLSNVFVFLYLAVSSWRASVSCRPWTSDRSAGLTPCEYPGGNVYPRNLPPPCPRTPPVPNVYHIIFPPPRSPDAHYPSDAPFGPWNYLAVKAITKFSGPAHIVLHYPRDHPAVRTPWFALAKNYFTDSATEEYNDGAGTDTGNADDTTNRPFPPPRDLLPPRILHRHGGILVHPSCILLRNASHLLDHPGSIPQTWDGDADWFAPRDADMDGWGPEMGNRFGADWGFLVAGEKGLDFLEEWAREASAGWWWDTEAVADSDAVKDDAQRPAGSASGRYPDGPAARLHRLAWRHSERVHILRRAGFLDARGAQDLLDAFDAARGPGKVRGAASGAARTVVGPTAKSGPSTPTNWTHHLVSTRPVPLAVRADSSMTDAHFLSVLDSRTKLRTGSGVFGAWDERDLAREVRDIVGGDWERVREILKGKGT